MGLSYGRKRGPKKLANTQELPPPSAGVMHPSKEEVGQKHQKACMDQQGTPGQTQAQKGSLQRVEARTGSLGGIQRNCLSSQGPG